MGAVGSKWRGGAGGTRVGGGHVSGVVTWVGMGRGRWGGVSNGGAVGVNGDVRGTHAWAGRSREWGGHVGRGHVTGGGQGSLGAVSIGGCGGGEDE